MTDVLKIALDRRAELHDEVAKLDEFIRMAESLISAGGSIAEPANDAGEEDADAKRPNVLRRGPTVING
jgi:hypothetical protein